MGEETARTSTANATDGQWRRIDQLLMTTSRHLRWAYDQALAPLDLSLSEASILALLDERGSLSQTAISQAASLGRASTGSHIDALERKGAVVRSPNAADRRVWLVGLTDHGHHLRKEVDRVDRAVRDQVRSGISREERQVLADVLLRLQSNLQQVRTPAPFDPTPEPKKKR